MPVFASVTRTSDIKVLLVATHGQVCAKFIGPLDRVVCVKADLGVGEAILLCDLRERRAVEESVLSVRVRSWVWKSPLLIQSLRTSTPNVFTILRPSHSPKIVWCASTPATQRRSCCSN